MKEIKEMLLGLFCFVLLLIGYAVLVLAIREWDLL